MVRCTTIHRIYNISTISQSAGYSTFFIMYRQEVPLPFHYALANPSEGTMQPETTSPSINTAKNAIVLSYTTYAPEFTNII